MKKKGLLVIISGFSGVGKGTVINSLLNCYADLYSFSVSATTRAPREGETHGEEYFFLTREEFEQLIQEKKLIEYARYVENYYGTPEEYVFQKLEQGQNVILDIEYQGALQVKKKYPEALLIFLIPPDIATLRSRLSARGTETGEQIQDRMKRALEEVEVVDQYECILVNRDLDACVQDMHRVINNPSLAEEYRSSNLALARHLKDDIERMIKGE